MEKSDLYGNKEWAGDPYMPSNGTSGEMFESVYCDRCIHQHPDPDNEHQCWDILHNALAGNQPEEWVYDADGKPTCTAFQKWDWGNEDDGWNEPPTKPEDPDDPNQLLLPLDITALFGFNDLVVTKQAIIEEELL